MNFYGYYEVLEAQYQVFIAKPTRISMSKQQCSERRLLNMPPGTGSSSKPTSEYDYSHEGHCSLFLFILCAGIFIAIYRKQVPALYHRVLTIEW